MKRTFVTGLFLLTISCMDVYAQDTTGIASKDTALTTAIPGTRPVSTTANTAVVPASLQYSHASGLQKLVFGENYRDEWSMPVKMNLFKIRETHGGMRITERGGGKQTVSVTLADSGGTEWKLRTIDKDPANALPPNLRVQVARDIVQEMISAAHPYAPLPVATLSDAAGIPHTNPEFYYVPDDTALGKYRQLLSNKVMMMERKDATIDGSEAKNTLKVMEEMMEDNDHLADQEAVLKARLLDILIGDWDRHLDQWRWGIIDTGKGKLYYPIPKDRDQAFFYSDGLALKYISWHRLPFLKGLRYDIPRVNYLGFPARDFDRFFLNELDENDWRRITEEFQAQMTDSILEAAVLRMPAEVYPFHGQEITEKLKSRRDKLLKAAMKYYRFLSEAVTVTGSNKADYFKIEGDGKNILVRVFQKGKGHNEGFLKYSRSFDPEITKEIRLFGMDGKDLFTVDKSTPKGIKIRLIGGKGKDTFDMKGSARKIIYDLSTEKNDIQADGNTRNMTSDDTAVNSYRYEAFKYKNMEHFPGLILGYNTEDGVLAGLNFRMITHGFRKEPFATDNRLSMLYSFFGKAYQLKYSGTFTDIYKKMDLVANAEYQNPGLNNFFGLGNDTRKVPGIGMHYYRVRYKYISAHVAGKFNLSPKSSIAIGPDFFYYWSRYQDNKDRILGKPEPAGYDSASVYDAKTYFGGRMSIKIDNTNSEIFPTRGIDWETKFQYLAALNDNSHSLPKLQSDLVIYKELIGDGKFIGILRLGGGRIFTDSFDYFQALTIGANNYLRGYRKDRFSGSSSFYNNVELRVKLKDVHSYLFPGTLGLIGYNDIGRVWVKGESSSTWHDAWGGGFYYLPFNLFILSATAGISPEGTLFNISLGTKLNIIF